jgi:hypothetical protein
VQIILACKNAIKKPNEFCDANQILKKARFLEFRFKKKPIWKPWSHGDASFHLTNPFQSRDAIWHHTFNSVLHMLQFRGGGGAERVNPFQPKKIVAYKGQY